MPSFLDDPRRRAMAQFGLGMLGNAGTGRGLGVGLMEAGTSALGTYDQMVAQKKMEERQARLEAMQRAEHEQMMQVRGAKLKKFEKEMKQIEETEAGRKKVTQMVERIPGLMDPAHQERVAKNAMMAGAMYGVDVSGLLKGYTREGQEESAARSAAIESARASTEASRAKTATEEQTRPYQIQALQDQGRITESQLAENKAQTAAVYEQLKGLKEERAAKATERADAGQPISVAPINLPDGRQVYQITQGSKRGLMPGGTESGLAPLPSQQKRQETPPPQTLDPAMVEQMGIAKESQDRQQAASQTLRGIASSENRLLYGVPGVGGNPQEDLANIKAIYGDLSDEDKKIALELIGKLQSRIRRR